MAKFDVVQAWIDNVAYSHSKSENTEQVYRHNLTRFCDFIGKTPEQILKEYEAMTDRDFRRKYAAYVRALISHLMNQSYSPSTVANAAGTVKSFFKYNDLPLGHVPVGRRRVIFHNRDITQDEIERILEISRPRDKAFFCMMLQTGLRPETMCKLQLKHLPEFENGTIPCKIDVPEAIAKGQYRSYWTFMGPESLKYLKAYLAKRPGVKPDDYLFASHGTDKMLNPKSISMIFARAIQKLKEKGTIELEESQFGKPGKLRLYNLRKYFRKMSHQAGFEVVQFCMGHIVKEGVDEHYRPQDPDFYRKLYKEKMMPYLRVGTATPTDIDKIMSKQAKKIRELEQKLKRFDEDEEKLQKQLDKFSAIADKIEIQRKIDEVDEMEVEDFIKTLGPKALRKWQRLMKLATEFDKYMAKKVEEDMRTKGKLKASKRGRAWLHDEKT